MTWIVLHLCLPRFGDQGNTFMLNLCVFLICFFLFSYQFQEISVVFRFSQFYVNATKLFEREVVLSSSGGRELTFWSTFSTTFLLGHYHLHIAEQKIEDQRG